MSLQKSIWNKCVLGLCGAYHSQVLENWCFEKECLSLFAKHYETGELISDETIERMQGLRTFHEGLATMVTSWLPQSI